jgi:hypothetical protein
MTINNKKYFEKTRFIKTGMLGKGFESIANL